MGEELDEFMCGVYSIPTSILCPYIIYLIEPSSNSTGVTFGRFYIFDGEMNSENLTDARLAPS